MKMPSPDWLKVWENINQRFLEDDRLDVVPRETNIVLTKICPTG
jgi:hypothetical protein